MNLLFLGIFFSRGSASEDDGRRNQETSKRKTVQTHGHVKDKGKRKNERERERERGERERERENHR